MSFELARCFYTVLNLCFFQFIKHVCLYIFDRLDDDQEGADRFSSALSVYKFIIVFLLLIGSDLFKVVYEI